MVAPRHHSKPRQRRLPITPVAEVDRHIEEAVKALYRQYRAHSRAYPDEAGDDTAEALNFVLTRLKWLAVRLGKPLDFAEHAEGLDVEFVSEEEFERRPEPPWFAIAKRLLDPDLLYDPEALTEVVAEYQARMDGCSIFDRGGAA